MFHNNLVSHPSAATSSNNYQTIRTKISTLERNWRKHERKTVIDIVKDAEAPKFEMDLTKPLKLFEKSEELKTADERIKKILSLEFASAIDFKQARHEAIRQAFQIDLDNKDDTLDTKAAMYTVQLNRIVKRMQIENGYLRPYHNKIYTLFTRRDRVLTLLRSHNLERYEWLIEKLGLEKHRMRDPHAFRRHTRWGLFTMQVKKQARKSRNEMLRQLKDRFAAELPNFLAKRDKEMLQLIEEFRQLGYKDLQVPPSIQQIQQEQSAAAKSSATMETKIDK